MTVRLLIGDCRDVLKTLPGESVQCCVTSPPYWGLRDYGVGGQLGLEKTPDEYVANMVAVFREVRRVLRDDGTLWLNLGDSYCGAGYSNHTLERNGLADRDNGRCKHSTTSLPSLKSKDLVGIPWRVAFALQADGWYLRSDIIWHKPNPMPESVRDRPTKAHEYLFLLTKAPTYYYDADAIAEPCVAGDNGSSFVSEYDLLTKPALGRGPRKQRKPAGWDTGDGAHGAFHRDGRALEVEYTETASTTRNRRSVWTVATQPFSGAHFATFPPKLIEPCILAGTSPQACEHCAAPWERVTERTSMVLDRSERTHSMGRTRTSGTMVEPPTSTTTGWQPTCDCADNTGAGRCVVLDPFGGAGTTGLVADRLGRDAILIELNPSYASLGSNRITDDAPLFASVEVTDVA